MTKFPTDRQSCLCCAQLVYRGGNESTVAELEMVLNFLESLGYTRHDLLTKHREQCEYQLPGMIEWLTAQ